MTTKARRFSRRRIVVAIDGPAGAGKSTLAMQLARALGYQVVDTGAMYRAVALLARRRGIPWDAEVALAELAQGLDVSFAADRSGNRVFLAGEDVSEAIRTPEISDGASRVSALPGVRSGLLERQRRLGKAGGVIAEGRDIGTVVFPAAEVKLFVTAADTVRARRRYLELAVSGADVQFHETLDDLRQRDRRDTERAVAPLVPAEDAVVIDSTKLGAEGVLDLALGIVRERERGPS